MDLYFQEHEVDPNAPNRRHTSRQSTQGLTGQLNALLLSEVTTVTTRSTSQTATNNTNVNTNDNSNNNNNNNSTNTNNNGDDEVTPSSASMLPLLSIAIRDISLQWDGGTAARDNGPPPASKEFIENLPNIPSTSVLNKKKDKKESSTSTPVCAVCTDEFDYDDTDITQLPCRHYYHRSCVVSWISRHAQCPLCRKELPTDDEEYEQMRRMKRREEAVSQMRGFMFN